MRKDARAGMLLAGGALAAASAYVFADGADLVPGLLTFRPPLPSVAAFPEPSPVTASVPSIPGFKTETDVDKARFQKLVSQFAGDYRLKNAAVSFWLGDINGVTLAQHNADKALTAASTTKLLTATAALSELGAQSRLRTLVAWNDQERKLYLIGGGDVLLGAGEDIPGEASGYAGLATLAQDTVSALVDESGASLLAGEPYTLLYDTSWFGTETQNPKWAAGFSQWAGLVQGLALDTGRKEPGKWGYHPDPAAHVAQVFADSLGKIGTFQSETNLKTVAPSKIVPGISGLAKTDLLDPTADLPTLHTDPTDAGQTRLVAYAQGAPLSLVVRDMLKESDNTIAENLGRLVALHRKAKPDFANSGQAVMSALNDLGIELGGTQLVGLSGLAHDTRITAHTLAQTIIVDGNTKFPQLHSILGNLPAAGADGTLSDAYRGTLAAGNLRGKTGTLDNTNSLAGTFVYQNQVLVYALIISGYPQHEGGQIIAAKQEFFNGLLGEPTDFSPTPPPEKQSKKQPLSESPSTPAKASSLSSTAPAPNTAAKEATPAP